MPYDVDLSPDMGLDPLDVSGLAPTPQPRSGFNFNAKEMAPLMALIPLAAKGGGMGAIGALLQGFQRARLIKQQQGRQAGMDARADQRMRMQDQAQQAAAQDRRLQQQSQFRSQFAQGLSVLDNEEAVRAYLQLQYPTADALGVGRQDLDSYALQVSTPNALLARKVNKRWDSMSPSEKEVAQRGFSLMIDGRPIPHQQWFPLVGGVMDSNTGKYPQEPAPPPVPPKPVEAKVPTPGSFEEYVNLPPDQQKLREEQRKRFLQSDDRPPAITVNAGGQGIPPATVRRVDAKVKAFEALPVVKRTQVMAESVSFADGLNPNTTNPADDQALIYAFAKAMDPDSVVREGEYATVQKYAQSWAETFGFNAARVFSNTSFLTPQARQNMKRTIRSRYLAARNQYDNVRRSYADQINRITGAPDGEQYLTDFAAAFPDGNGAPSATPPAAGGVTYQDYLRSRQK